MPPLFFPQNYKSRSGLLGFNIGKALSCMDEVYGYWQFDVHCFFRCQILWVHFLIGRLLSIKRSVTFAPAWGGQ